MELLHYAALGDLASLKRLAIMKDCDLNFGDYDGRTALHLAASEGHRDVVNYLIESHISINPTDRWGNTPLDDANRGMFVEVIELLIKNGAQGKEQKLKRPYS